MPTLKPIFQRKSVFLPIFGIMGLLMAITIAGMIGESSINNFFTELHQERENLFSWLQTPKYSHSFYLVFPTLVSWGLVQIVMKLSPQQKQWSRVIIIATLMFLIVRYLGWRSLSSLNLSEPINGIFSVSLLLIEVCFFLITIFQLILLLTVKPRHEEAERMQIAVLEGSYHPMVDILIPTYNEPISILKKTIIGCQAINYINKRIYILDDGDRTEVHKLTQELGCDYITRNDHNYAKAGNLNHALTKTAGELIVVFDADFIPTSNFLTRTVGFFQNPQIALLQTYQSFYNPDPLSKNLGLEEDITQEVEVFSRHYQLLRDGLETALCYGSSFLVRRKILEEIGGFVTDSLSEDYFTSVRLTAQGHKVIYLGESLSAGLSAETMSTHIRQRMRWSRGSLQAFFIPENPATIPGLTIWQRIAHLEGIIQWLTNLFRVFFLFFPFIDAFLDLVPVKISFYEWLYFFTPLYLTQLLTFSWLNNYSRSAFISDLYGVTQCFPISLNVIQTLISPFSEPFKVTPKGTYSDKFRFNWGLAFPLIFVLTLNLISFSYSLAPVINDPSQLLANLDTEVLGEKYLAWFWSIYNIIILILAILAMLDVPKPNNYEWFNLQHKVCLSNGDMRINGVSQKISELGAEIKLDQPWHNLSNLKLKFLDNGLQLPVHVSEVNSTQIKVNFEQVSLNEYRQLIQLLFCQPGRWQQSKNPGELQSLWLLIKALIKPRFLQKLTLSISPLIPLQKSRIG
jgi:cellulose synthase (UDP-forming)